MPVAETAIAFSVEKQAHWKGSLTISQPDIIYVKVMLMKINKSTEEVWGRVGMQKGHRGSPQVVAARLRDVILVQLGPFYNRITHINYCSSVPVRKLQSGPLL